jgi:DNA-binding transcriptional LysR family regulator
MLQMNSRHYYYARMEFEDLRTFVTVAEAGSVSGAARELYVTQSAVTRRLQRLETAIGAPLLDRATRPVSLTGPGQVVLERCRRLLNDFREVRAAVANGHLPMEEVKIGVAHALTELTLTEPIEEVRRKYPKVALRLLTGWSHDLLERVRSGALDAAVILLDEGEKLPTGVNGKQVGKEQLLLVAPRRGVSRPRKIQDLAGANWILNPEGCAARAALRRTLRRANIDMVVAVETYNYELQMALVARNRGFSLAPERILTRSRCKSSLQVIRLPGLNFPLTIWAVERQPCAGLDAVITELSRALMEKL